MKEEYIFGGHTITIENDDDSNSPREDDNLGTMLCRHKSYNLGDVEESKKIPWGDFESWKDAENYIYKKYDVAILLPVFMYDHSGLAFNTTGFSCGWDSGQVGFILIEKSKVRKEYSVKRIGKKLLDQVKGYLKQEVKTYSQWHEGDVYGYTITDKNGDEVESCWGFYGYDYVKEQAESAVPPSNAEHFVKSFEFLINQGVSL